MFKTLARRPRRGRRRDARDARPPLRARAGRQRDRRRTQERRRVDGSVRPAPFLRMVKTPSPTRAFALCAGTLHSIDQYLNIKLLNTKVVDAARHPQLVAVTSVLLPAPALLLSSPRSCFSAVPRPLCRNLLGSQVFVRGSVVRYIQIPAADVDTELLRVSPRPCDARARAPTRAFPAQARRVPEGEREGVGRRRTARPGRPRARIVLRTGLALSSGDPRCGPRARAMQSEFRAWRGSRVQTSRIYLELT